MKNSFKKSYLVLTGIICIAIAFALFFYSSDIWLWPELDTHAAPSQEKKITRSNLHQTSLSPLPAKSHTGSPTKTADAATNNLQKYRDTRQLGTNTSQFTHIAPIINQSNVSNNRTHTGRSQKARVLNNRTKQRLIALKEQRDQATGAKRDELEASITAFERNVELRSRIETDEPLPKRPSSVRH